MQGKWNTYKNFGWALAIGHYDAALAVQSASALNSIKFVFTILPLIASALAVVLNLIYDLDKKMPQILHDLKTPRITVFLCVA